MVVRDPPDDQADRPALVDQVVDAFSGIEFLDRPSRVTDQGVGDVKLSGETLDCVHAVSTDTHDLGIEGFQGRHVSLKAQRRGFSGRGENGEIKRQNDVLFPQVIGQRDLTLVGLCCKIRRPVAHGQG